MGRQSPISNLKYPSHPFRYALLLWTGLLVFASFGHATAESDARFCELYDHHQLFKLRDAVQDTPDAPLFYKAAVAHAFNDTARCEQDLLTFLRSAPSTSQTLEARNLLTYLYFRTGRFSQALAQSEQAVALGGESQDQSNVRSLMRALSHFPAMTVTRFLPSSIHVWRKNGFFPARMNGQRFKCLFDTGADLSLISETAAKRLKLTTVEMNGVKMGDSTGYGLTIGKVAVADRLAIGQIELRHVPFIVVSDQVQSLLPWNTSRSCILGIPVMRACKTVSWKSGWLGPKLELGAPSGPRNLRDSNLCYDGLKPHVSAAYGKETLELLLDTGADRTVLFQRFAKAFPALVNDSSKKGVHKFAGLGGRTQMETRIIPNLSLRLGGLDLTCHNQTVYMKDTDSPWCHGVAAGDIIKGTREVKLDFEAMTMTVK